LTTLFVGNLSPDVSEHNLRSVFEVYGRVSSIRLVSRRRLAYVELDAEAAYAAVDGLRNTQIKGRTMDVVLDRPAGARPGRRGGKSRR